MRRAVCSGSSNRKSQRISRAWNPPSSLTLTYHYAPLSHVVLKSLFNVSQPSRYLRVIVSCFLLLRPPPVIGFLLSSALSTNVDRAARAVADIPRIAERLSAFPASGRPESLGLVKLVLIERAVGSRGSWSHSASFGRFQSSNSW